MTQPRRSPRTEDAGTALAQALPWCQATDDLATAVRQWLDGTGSEREMARCLHNCDQAAREMLGENVESEPPNDRGPAHKGLYEMRYRG